MDSAAAALLVFVLLVFAGLTVAGLSAWWLAPARRLERALQRKLGVVPEAVVTASNRGQGLALDIDGGRLAVIRGPGDQGLVFDFDEVVGAELVFDGEVKARAFRGEARKALDQTMPQVSRVMVRLVFDDVRDPDFELHLFDLGDAADARSDPEAAVRAARRLFSRMEAMIRRNTRSPS